jgi:hypothetical protein
VDAALLLVPVGTSAAHLYNVMMGREGVGESLKTEGDWSKSPSPLPPEQVDQPAHVFRQNDLWEWPVRALMQDL